MTHPQRPSRKHILDWIGRPDFRNTLNALLRPSGVSLGRRDIHRPVGHRDGLEFELADFCLCFRPRWGVHERLRDWWLPASALTRNARTPIWDLISTCTVAGREGLLLVDAKTHEGELGWKGKELAADADKASVINHEHIRDAMNDVSQRLTQVAGARVSLSIDSHYQLATRVGWAVAVASWGIPVALLYLGFTGDLETPRFLRDDAHWQRLMGAYMIGKLPLGLPEKWLSFPGGGAFAFLIRSLPVYVDVPNGRKRMTLEDCMAATPRAARKPLNGSQPEDPTPAAFPSRWA